VGLPKPENAIAIGHCDGFSRSIGGNYRSLGQGTKHYQNMQLQAHENNGLRTKLAKALSIR
jgi:hypothetical protein